MNYKKVIKNQKTRIAILNLFSFVPDKLMLQLQYRIKTGYKLNLNNPKRYTEKLQWYKLFYRDPIMKECADKGSVREFVSARGLSHILNKCYGVYDSPEEIPFDTLPNSFVLKDTLGGGGNSVLLIRDKRHMDKDKLLDQLKQWVNAPIDKKNIGREWVYEKRKHRIIVEKLLDCPNGDLPDYKFFCFNGKVAYIYMMSNYREHHELGQLAFLDKDFKLLKVSRDDFNSVMKQPDKPQNYNEMLEMAEILSTGFPHVRVDFYNINGTIIFGEMTFFNASGYCKFIPDEFDFVLGEYFKLPERGRN